MIEVARRVANMARVLLHLLRFGGATGAAWLVPVVILLVMFVGMAATTQVVAPYVVYTFF